MTKSADQIKAEFSAKLKALLEEYRAEVVVVESNCGWATVVDGIHIEFEAEWDKDGELISDFATLELGQRFDHTFL